MTSITFQSQSHRVPPLIKPNCACSTPTTPLCIKKHSEQICTHTRTHTYRGRKEWEQWIRKTGSLLQEWILAAEKQTCCPEIQKHEKITTSPHGCILHHGAHTACHLLGRTAGMYTINIKYGHMLWKATSLVNVNSLLKVVPKNCTISSSLSSIC